MDKLTALQKEFLDLLKKLKHCDESTEQGLIQDIRAMNAVELRQNIAVFRDTSAQEDLK